MTAVAAALPHNNLARRQRNGRVPHRIARRAAPLVVHHVLQRAALRRQERGNGFRLRVRQRSDPPARPAIAENIVPEGIRVFERRALQADAHAHLHGKGRLRRFGIFGKGRGFQVQDGGRQCFKDAKQETVRDIEEQDGRPRLNLRRGRLHVCRQAKQAPPETLIHGIGGAAKDKARSRHGGPGNVVCSGRSKIGKTIGFITFDIIIVIVRPRFVERHERGIPNGLHEGRSRCARQVLAKLRRRRRQQQIGRHLEGRGNGKFRRAVPFHAHAVTKAAVFLRSVVVGIVVGIGIVTIQCLHVHTRTRHEGGALNVARVAHGKKQHDLTIVCSIIIIILIVVRCIDQIGVFSLDVPLLQNGAVAEIVLRGGAHQKVRRRFGLEQGRGPTASGVAALKVINGCSCCSCRCCCFVVIIHCSFVLLLFVVARKTAQLGFAVRKVTGRAKGTIARRKVLAQTNLVKFVRFGSRSPRANDCLVVIAVFIRASTRLHLRQAQRKVRHHGQVVARPRVVLVATKRPVNAKTALVKGALHSIRLANVAERAVLDLAALAVPAQWHFGEIVLVQKLARRALHAEVAEPVAADHGAQAGIVFGARQYYSGSSARCCCCSITTTTTLVVATTVVLVGKDGTRLAVGQRIQRVGNPVRQGKILKVVFHRVDANRGTRILAQEERR